MCLYKPRWFGLILCMTLLITTSISETHPDFYCEIFQNTNFRGESLQVPDSQEIVNFTQIIQSWILGSNSKNNAETKLISFKVPFGISSGATCAINACTSENFGGNCTIFKLSRKRIMAAQLKSFKCNCFNEKDDEANISDDIPVDFDSSQSTKRSTCDDEVGVEPFRHFTKTGKKIIGVGRNYIWHNTDLSTVVANGTAPDKPIIFLKPSTSYLLEGNKIHLPANLGPIYYELELAVIIGKEAKNVPETDALDYVAGYALALDMTAKEILKTSISKGLPWELSKGFDGACPIGNFLPRSCIPDPHDLQLSCSVNGVLQQNDSTSRMIFKIPQLISYVSQHMSLEPNDIFLTGTPDGFGQIKSGDVIEGSINDDLANIKFVIA